MNHFQRCKFKRMLQMKQLLVKDHDLKSIQKGDYLKTFSS